MGCFLGFEGKCSQHFLSARVFKRSCHGLAVKANSIFILPGRAENRRTELRMSETAMASKLTDAHRSLVRAKEAAKKRLEELDDERREIRASLKSLEAALKALGRSNRRRATSRPVVDVDDNDELASKAATDGS